MNRPQPHQVIEACFERALEKSAPRLRVSSRITDRGEWLSIGSTRLRDVERFAVFAVGKAATGMLWGAHDAIGERIDRGLAIAKHTAPVPPNCELVLGDHPLPGEQSLHAGRRAIEFLEGLPEGMPVVACISGGGSALMTAPAAGITLAEIRERTDSMLKSGADIGEINAVRGSLDEVKQGGLAGHLRGPAVALVISDVNWDPIDVIASGPFAVDAVPHHVISNVMNALDPARWAAHDHGYAWRIEASRMEGDARLMGEKFAELLIGYSGARPGCVLLGGESTVKVTGTGHGGPNLEFALAAARRLDGIEGITVGTLTTDGEDGPTDAAGAIVDGFTAARAREFGFDIDEALANNDSYPLLDAIGALVKTGPTGNNINDIIVGLVEPNGG